MCNVYGIYFFFWQQQCRLPSPLSFPIFVGFLLFLAGWDWRAELWNSSRIALGLVPDPHPCPWPRWLPDGINLEIIKWCGLEGPEGHLFKPFFYRNEGIRGTERGCEGPGSRTRAHQDWTPGAGFWPTFWPASLPPSVPSHLWAEWVWMGK